MTWSKQIYQYKFEDSVSKLSAITLIHFLFSIILLFYAPDAVLQNYRLIICFLIFLIFFIASFTYNWLSQPINAFFLAFYLTSLFVEYIFLGIPATPFDFSNGYAIGRGVMFDIVVVLMPYVYCGLRMGFMLLIISVIHNSGRVQKFKQIDHDNILDAGL